METLNTLMAWVPWLLGGSTLALIAVIAVAAFGGGAALKIASTIIDAVSPLLKGAAEGVVWFVKKLGEGAAICCHNPPTFAVILTTLILGGYFLTDVNPKTIKAKVEVTALKKENATLRKRAVQVRPATKPVRKAADNFWSGWAL